MKITIVGHQTLALTPKVYQSIELLQWPQDILNEFIDNHVNENPLLVRKDFKPKIENPHQFDIPGKASFTDQLLQQIHITFKKKREQDFAIQLMHELDQHGYLRESVDDLSQKLRIDPYELVPILNVLKTFEPVGVFSQNLKEYLSIRLKDSNQLCDSMKKFLEALDLFSELSFEKFAKYIRVPLEECKKLLSIIQKCSPYPVESDDNLACSLPDLCVFFAQQRWDVCLNEGVLPKISMDCSPFSKVQSESDLKYLRAQKLQANWLINTLSKRFQTLLNVSKVIINHQQDFFNHGTLKPLILKDIAKALTLNESTVSRAIRNKLIETPRGVYELKFFLSHSVNIDLYRWDDDKTASRSILLNLQKIIKKEPRKNPFSDDRLVSSLRDEGIVIARRTIAKYRKKLNIPPACKRKKQYERHA